jgi:hypothetical protein
VKIQKRPPIERLVARTADRGGKSHKKALLNFGINGLTRKYTPENASVRTREEERCPLKANSTIGLRKGASL